MKSDNEGERAAAGQVRLVGVGDILLSADPRGREGVRSPKEALAPVRRVFEEGDLVVGNLECTLRQEGDAVDHEALVAATEGQIRELRAAGLTAVSLANNHMFDFGWEGFRRLRELLAESGLLYFGAGENEQEASRGLIWDCNGLRVGLLAAADEKTGVPHVARGEHWGVAGYDVGRLCEAARRLREECEHVILSVHWGEERFFVPSPRQIEEAHALVESGVTVILGHHPHVLQGIERFGRGVIAYSLGNFLADSVYYRDGDILRWSWRERTGCILEAVLNRDGVGSVTQLVTVDEEGRVDVSRGRRQMALVRGTHAKIGRGVSWRRHRWEAWRVQVMLPLLRHLRWSQLKRLRPRHFAGLLRQVRAAKRRPCE